VFEKGCEFLKIDSSFQSFIKLSSQNQKPHKVKKKIKRETVEILKRCWRLKEIVAQNGRSNGVHVTKVKQSWLWDA
jgi:hypothetical protein